MSEYAKMGFDKTPTLGRGPFGDCLVQLDRPGEEMYVRQVAMVGDLFYVARAVVSEHGYDDWTPAQRLEAILAVYQALIDARFDELPLTRPRYPWELPEPKDEE